MTDYEMDCVKAESRAEREATQETIALLREKVRLLEEATCPQCGARSVARPSLSEAQYVTRVQLFNELITERERQDRQWGGPGHDDEHVLADWANFIDRQLDKMLSGDEVRQRLIKVAALAIAALESAYRIGVCPSEYETNTGCFDPSGEPSPEICAGCGCHRDEHAHHPAEGGK